MRVHLWQSWPGDGVLYPAGEEIEVSADLAETICQAGAGEIVSNVVEVAVATAPERAVSRRQRKRRR